MIRLSHGYDRHAGLMLSCVKSAAVLFVDLMRWDVPVVAGRKIQLPTSGLAD